MLIGLDHDLEGFEGLMTIIHVVYCIVDCMIDLLLFAVYCIYVC